MKTKNYLLPHDFQKIGWGLFIIFTYSFARIKLHI